MVSTQNNIVHMGVGDVGVLYTAEGTIKKPIGSVIFFNQEKQPIRGLPEEHTILEESIGSYTSYPDKEICLSFSSAESIDALMSLLQAMKKNVFEDEEARKVIFSSRPTL